MYVSPLSGYKNNFCFRMVPNFCAASPMSYLDDFEIELFHYYCIIASLLHHYCIYYVTVFLFEVVKVEPVRLRVLSS